MSDYKDTPIIERLRGNILFNWSHLSHYGDDMQEAADVLEQVQTENKNLRIKLYKVRQVKGCDHNTACSIWGDNGQGMTIEGWTSLPCNCGALLNFKQKRIEQLEADFELATNLRDEAVSDLYTANDHIEQLEAETRQ